MLTIHLERVAPIIETELWPLLEEHREELTTNKALMRLAPLVEVYREAEEREVFFALIARKDGRVVGYSGNFVSRHLHYGDLLVVENDVLFVRPDERGTVGLRLLDATEREAKARGAQIMLWHAKPKTALEFIMARRRDTRVQDVIFSRTL